MTGFFEREAGKEPQFSDSALAGIEGSELGQCRVEIEQIDVERSPGRDSSVERDAGPLAGTLRGAMRARPVHENTAHDLSRHREKLRPATPRCLPLIDQPEIRLVDQSCRLQQVPLALAAHVCHRAPAQLFVHEHHHLLARIEVAFVPWVKERRHVGSRQRCLVRQGDLDVWTRIGQGDWRAWSKNGTWVRSRPATDRLDVHDGERLCEAGSDCLGRRIRVKTAGRDFSSETRPRRGLATIRAMPKPSAVTRLLRAWSDGDESALDSLLPLVDAELRRHARSYMARERLGHTLQTTALVNEAFMRLVNARSVSCRIARISSALPRD